MLAALPAFLFHACNSVTFLQAKTLAINNNDRTDDVIRMALQQFGISVSNNANKVHVMLKDLIILGVVDVTHM